MNIPTAEEFSKNFTRLRSALALQDLTDLMISFAALHVQAALKEASKNVVIEGNSFEYELDKNSILNAYPLENIK